MIVFGDSWSGSDQDSAVNAKEHGSWWPKQNREVQTLWVDELCSHLACNKKSIFAQPYPSLPTHQLGAVVDAEVFGNATAFFNFTLQPDNIPDLRAQVNQFLAEDVSSTVDPQANYRQTIFTAFFGLWEIWTFVALANVDAERAVSESVGSLFSEIDRLLESKSARSTHPIIVLPRLPDATLLPRWVTSRTESSDEHGLLQKQAVFLTEQWNNLLESRAKAYEKVDILLPDFGQWMLEIMREPDRAEYDSIYSRLGRLAGVQPTFADLIQPCVNYTASSETESQQLPVICADSGRHLFWFVADLSEPL